MLNGVDVEEAAGLMSGHDSSEYSSGLARDSNAHLAAPLGGRDSCHAAGSLSTFTYIPTVWLACYFSLSFSVRLPVSVCLSLSRICVRKAYKFVSSHCTAEKNQIKSNSKCRIMYAQVLSPHTHTLTRHADTLTTCQHQRRVSF
jgi:hypothetical protein